MPASYAQAPKDDVTHPTSSDHQQSSQVSYAAQTIARMLFEHGSDIITLVDEAGTILYQHPPAQPQAAGSADSPVARCTHIRQVLHSDDLADFDGTRLRALEPGGVLHIPAHRVRGPHHDWRWMESSVVNLLHDEAVGAFLVRSSDITERYLGELRTASLQAVTAALTTSTRPAEVVRVVVDQGLRLMDAVGGVLFALSPQGDALELLGSQGYPPQAQQQWSHLPLSVDVPATRVVQSGQPLFLNHAERQAEFSHLLPLLPKDAVSSAVLPMTVDGRTIGAIGLGFAQDRSFDRSEREFLQTLAAQCALSLNRGRLYLELEDREARYRKLTRHSPGMVTILAPDGTLQHESDSVLGVLGYHPEELVGQALLPYIHPDDQSLALDTIKRAFHHPTEMVYISCRFLHRNGSWRWLECVGTALLHDPHVGGLLINSWDVTARKNAEEDLKRNEAFLTRVMHSSADCIKILDREGRVMFINEGGMRLLEVENIESLHGESWPEQWSEEQRPVIAQALHEARCQRTGTFQGRLATRTGQQKWFDVAITAVPDEHGEPDRLLVVARDITTVKAAEQEQLDHNRVLEMTVQNKPLESVINEVALMVERQAPDHLCSIMLVQHGRLTLSAAPSAPSSFRDLLSDWPIEVGAGVCGTAAATATTVVVEDVRTHAYLDGLRHLLLPYGMQAMTSVPVLDGDQRVLGALGLYSKRLGPPSAANLAILEKARHLVAVVIEQRRLAERLRYQAQHDALTGLPNRTLFTERLGDDLAMAERHGHSLALLFIDLDDFKGVNDSLGHEVGDLVLQEAARRLATCVRRGDTLARLGGDEFTAVLPFAGEEEARNVAERILSSFAQPLSVAGRELYVSPSVGICVYPDGARDVETMLRHADLAMYRAKHRKLGLTVFESDMNRQAFERLHLSTFLRRAMELNELELHYQPQIRLEDGAQVGVEALLRWRHPHLGMVSPAQFIPLAEESGLIVPIGEWVLRKACRQGVVWQQQGLPPLRIAVNVSALQFARPDFVKVVARALQDSGLSPEYLELELTERVIMTDVQESVSRMTSLRELGVSISVDDFGTGYSSLSYLPRLPINILKIDRAFVTDLRRDSLAFPVVKAIVSLAQALGLITIAEGIETAEELSELRELGCGFGQGYLFAKPLPASDVCFTASTVSPR